MNYDKAWSLKVLSDDIFEEREKKKKCLNNLSIVLCHLLYFD